MKYGSVSLATSWVIQLTGKRAGQDQQWPVMLVMLCSNESARPALVVRAGRAVLRHRLDEIGLTVIDRSHFA
jgi:hypothetical protein